MFVARSHLQKMSGYNLRVGGARVCTEMARPYRTSASSKLLPKASTPSILSFHYRSLDDVSYFVLTYLALVLINFKNLMYGTGRLVVARILQPFFGPDL